MKWYTAPYSWDADGFHFLQKHKVSWQNRSSKAHNGIGPWSLLNFSNRKNLLFRSSLLYNYHKQRCCKILLLVPQFLLFSLKTVTKGLSKLNWTNKIKLRIQNWTCWKMWTVTNRKNAFSTVLGKANKRELWVISCIYCHMNFIAIWHDCKVSGCKRNPWYTSIGVRGIVPNTAWK